MQVMILEGLLTLEQQLVHLPEPSLKRRCLRRGRCGEGVRVDLGQRKCTYFREPDVAALLDRLVTDELPGRRGLKAWTSMLPAHATLLR